MRSSKLPAMLNRLMLQRIREMRAFRSEHGASLLTLMNAEDDYRNGGPIEPFREAIETACRERPELAAQIRRPFAWVAYNGTTDQHAA